MNLVFFTHPNFIGHQSMPRFANMLADGMSKRGHQVENWSPQPGFFNLPVPNAFKKWLGYADQYLVFPKEIRKKLKAVKPNTLFVFTDHALGPWVPLVVHLPHVIHCHDFIAQQSALDLISENPTSWTGKQYQAFIRRGYSQGKNFISVSKKTQQDLHKFVDPSKINSEVVYNGLNQSFEAKEVIKSRIEIGNRTGIDLEKGYLLHIGGNQFYKNRTGVVEIYDAWRSITKTSLPLLLIGEVPGEELNLRINSSTHKTDIYSLNNIEDNLINSAYSGASVFLFPSIAEGFGWPIAEAMACGCPVITTDEAPMTEVAGDSTFLIPKQPENPSEVKDWAINAAVVVEQIISFSSADRKKVVDAGLQNAMRFNTNNALDQIEKIYLNILEKHKNQ